MPTTTRMQLCKPNEDDLDELFALYSDSRLAEGDHLLAHSSIERTRPMLARGIGAWQRDGLGPWVLREWEVGVTPGALIGVGGCGLVANTAWNLSFSLNPRYWGKGYAQEVAAAGMEQAKLLRPEIPITAVVAQRNARSHRAVQRVGLSLVWEGPDSHDPDPSATVALYADRPLSSEQIDRLTN